MQENIGHFDALYIERLLHRMTDAQSKLPLIVQTQPEDVVEFENTTRYQLSPRSI